MNIYYKRTWCCIDLDKAKQNIEYFKNNYAKDIKLMCVVKADAYGHGDLHTCEAFLEGGADWFAVSSISEAISLREHGFKIPILVLGYTPTTDVPLLCEYDITQTIYCLDYANEMNQALSKLNKTLNVHIKADTGMGRLGFDCINNSVKDVALEISKVKELENLNLQGIFTHFSVADESSAEHVDFTYRQYQRFKELIDILSENGINFELKHCANSAGTLFYPEMKFDMIRVGISSYGLSPNGTDLPEMQHLQPLMQLKSVVSLVKTIQAGTNLSYGNTFTATTNMKIATIPVGYADGVRRSPNSPLYLLIKGKKAPIIGRICMDQLMIDVTNIEDIKIGDEVTLFGYSEDTYLSVDEFAKMCKTINYEIVCAISKRVPRVYYKNNQIVAVTNYLV